MSDRYVEKKRNHPDTKQAGWGVWDNKENKWLGSWHKLKAKARHYAKRANRVEKDG